MPISVSNLELTSPILYLSREALQSFLQRLLRITTIDSRIFLGTFAGTDKPLNIIFIDAEEYHISQGPGKRVKLSENGRYVGQVLLPWKTIVRVEVYERNNAMEKERRDKGDNIYL
ncbi:hypothetical protein BYT27DRAFT_6341200 [Phlegmacium glaucopus]|nr:hypothetical protein BYT27DRAFT_6341200 [Phlegmacium glaucopus]